MATRRLLSSPEVSASLSLSLSLSFSLSLSRARSLSLSLSLKHTDTLTGTNAGGETLELEEPDLLSPPRTDGAKPADGEQDARGPHAQGDVGAGALTSDADNGCIQQSGDAAAGSQTSLDKRDTGAGPGAGGGESVTEKPPNSKQQVQQVQHASGGEGEPQGVAGQQGVNRAEAQVWT